VRDGQPLFDSEGNRLLFKEDVAELRGVTVATITHHLTGAQRNRRLGKPAHFPAPYMYVRRVKTKSDGQPVASRTPVWRDQDIADWISHPLGPGGRPLSASGGVPVSVAS
jgi:hypothetical protein